MNRGQEGRVQKFKMATVGKQAETGSRAWKRTRKHGERVWGRSRSACDPFWAKWLVRLKSALKISKKIKTVTVGKQSETGSQAGPQMIKLWSFRVHFVSITYLPSRPMLILKPSSGIPDPDPFSLWDSWPSPLYSVLPRSSAVVLCIHALMHACHAAAMHQWKHVMQMKCGALWSPLLTQSQGRWIVLINCEAFLIWS